MNAVPEIIKEGDIVSVHFHGSQRTLTRGAVVRRVPWATGDSWIFECATGRMYHVSEGCTVERDDLSPTTTGDSHE